MFKRIVKLEQQLAALGVEFDKFKQDTEASDSSDRISDLERKQADFGTEFARTIDKLKNDVDKKMIDFHREVTEKYFETLEKIFRLNKEISLMTQLAGQVKEKDLNNLQSMMLQPFLEARWDDKKKKEGTAILNKGASVIDKRNALHAQMLQMEKRGESVIAIKEQIKAFDWIISQVREK